MERNVPDGAMAEPVPAVPGASGDGAQALEVFHEELRRKNVPVLFWSAGIFNVAYVAWTGFDYLLARAHWGEFLALRIAASTINTAVALIVHRNRRWAWEGFWLWLFVFGSFIAVMLPKVGDRTPLYTMGFTLILYGGGLLPFWKPVWSITNVACIIATVPIAFWLEPSNVPRRDIVGASFFVLTATGLSVVMASFKYDLAKRDYFTRWELQAAVRRESDARERLAAASAELTAALEKLKELDRLKSKFFANISHELRTPLTLILAPVEELLAAEGSVLDKERLSVVLRNAERLLRLIDDLLDLSKVDAGGLRLNVAELDVRTIAASVCDISRPAAAARSLTLALHAEPSTRRIEGDAHRLEIIITNLVSNAIKYTPEGGRIDVSVEDGANEVRVLVQDSGDGIPEEDLPHIFERFFQVERSDRRFQGGVGIGLALAKELVELHGGTITASSEAGKGASFSVAIPFGSGHIRSEVIERRRQLASGARPRRRADDDTPNHASTPPPPLVHSEPPPSGEFLASAGRKARIVVVEDQTELREFIAGLLRPSYDVLCASDGDAGFDLVAASRPDLVISDIMMPGRRGTELCRDIKADPALANTPVILLTARVGSEATLEGYAHGADEFVAKPFHPGVLLARARAQLKLRALGLQLAEREKLAAIGTLAAGVLHEVRNPVSAILNGAEVLATRDVDAKTTAKLLEVIRSGAGRIEGIMAALQAHARPAESQGAAMLDVREGLDATLALLAHRLGDVIVNRDYRTEQLVVGSAGSLNQVFLNLLDNALKSGAGALTLTVSAENDRLRVSVRDDGPGVPADAAERIFDPFFTTRQPGQGTGLGLYISRKIVETHHGRLWFENHAGGGTEFIVELPAARGGVMKDAHEEVV
jgi:signal transduction histidine kinase